MRSNFVKGQPSITNRSFPTTNQLLTIHADVTTANHDHSFVNFWKAFAPSPNLKIRYAMAASESKRPIPMSDKRNFASPDNALVLSLFLSSMDSESLSFTCPFGAVT